jgi:hypothetical protein
MVDVFADKDKVFLLFTVGWFIGMRFCGTSGNKTTQNSSCYISDL